MITVHHLENSRSQRVLWLLEELGLPYDVKRHARDKKTSLAPPELRQVHPLGKSPVITDGAITVAETGAIVEYLVDKAGGTLRPERGTADHRRYYKSLSGTCMSCHDDKAGFCDKCHDYLGVQPYCWDCHVEPKGDR